MSGKINPRIKKRKRIKSRSFRFGSVHGGNGYHCVCLVWKMRIEQFIMNSFNEQFKPVAATTVIF